MIVGSISIKTVEAIRQVSWTVKQAHEQFVIIYKQSFADCVGKVWESTWQTWDDFEEVVQLVEDQIKAICVESGMSKGVWTKYRTGCRNVTFFGIPFKFRTVTTKTILEARELADSYTDGTPEQRINRALKEIRDAKGTEYACNTATKGGMVLLRLPRDGEDSCAYSRFVLERIQTFLSNPKVQNAVGRQLDKLRQQIDAALTPGKKRRSA